MHQNQYYEMFSRTKRTTTTTMGRYEDAGRALPIHIDAASFQLKTEFFFPHPFVAITFSRTPKAYAHQGARVHVMYIIILTSFAYAFACSSGILFSSAPANITRCCTPRRGPLLNGCC